MIFYLSKNTQILWQIRIVFAISFLGIAVLLFCQFTWWFLLPTVLIVITGLLVAFLYIPFYFKSYKIKVFDNAIIIEKGFLFKTINIMPYPRLIFAQCVTSPLSTRMKMKSIILRASRGSVFIPELENSYANKLLDKIKIKKSDENDV